MLAVSIYPGKRLLVEEYRETPLLAFLGADLHEQHVAVAGPVSKSTSESGAPDDFSQTPFSARTLSRRRAATV